MANRRRPAKKWTIAALHQPLCVAAGLLMSCWSWTEFCTGFEQQTVSLTLQRSSEISIDHFKDLQILALRDAEIFLSKQILHDATDQPNLITQCLAPEICKVAGRGYYFDPYQNKCVKPSIFASVKGHRKPPEFPELKEACAKGIGFKDFLTNRGEDLSDQVQTTITKSTPTNAPSKSVPTRPVRTTTSTRTTPPPHSTSAHTTAAKTKPLYSTSHSHITSSHHHPTTTTHSMTTTFSRNENEHHRSAKVSAKTTIISKDNRTITHEKSKNATTTITQSADYTSSKDINNNNNSDIFASPRRHNATTTSLSSSTTKMGGESISTASSNTTTAAGESRRHNVDRATAAVVEQHIIPRNRSVGAPINRHHNQQ